MRSMTGAAYLEHFGVKGMHWGQRKQEKREKWLADAQVKGNKLVEAALAKPDRIVDLYKGGNHPTVVTGQQFVDHLMRGGAVDLGRTKVLEPAGAPHAPDIYRQVA